MKQRIKKVKVAILMAYLVAAVALIAGLGVDRAEADLLGIPFGVDTLR